MSMNILIVGGGAVGTVTAEYFSKEGHNVTVIEHDASRIRALQDRLDIIVIEGKGTDNSVLESANLDKIDLFLALTDNDEANIISCTLAKHAGVKKKIARISDSFFLQKQNAHSLKDLGVDEVVNTADSLIHEMVKMVQYPGMTDVKHYLENNFVVVKYSFSKRSPFYGKKLSEVKIPASCKPIGYQQVGDFMPYDATVTVNEFLYVYFATDKKHLTELHQILSAGTPAIKKVMIYGGGYKSSSTGLELASALKAEGVATIEIVDENPELAKRASAKGNFTVLIDDPSMPAFAKNGNLKNVDMFVGLSSSFEKNLYACSTAHRHSVPYTVTLVRYPEHTTFVSTIPLTAFLNPAIVTANSVMKYEEVDTIFSRTILEYEQVECMEINISTGSKLVGKKVNGLNFKKSSCLAIMRHGQLLSLTNDTVFQASDRALFLIVNGELEILRSHF